MNKKTTYALKGAFIGGLGNGLLNAINQLNEKDNYQDRKFELGELGFAVLKGAAIGGAAGLAVGALLDYQNSLEKPINTDAFLLSVVDKVRLSKNNYHYRLLSEKADQLILLVKKDLRDKLAGAPIRLGSTENDTALKDNFDIDICLNFKPNSFSSTEAMYSYLYDYFENLIGKQSIVQTRDQKKSIGVILEIRGKKHRIDIVPNKLIARRGNKTAGYLFVNDPFNPTYTKTDIHALKNFRLSETQKKIIIVLKNWKRKYDLPISSHLLQNLVVDAYKYNYVPRNITRKVMMVLQHIHDKIDIAVIRGVENSNNVLTNISESKKEEIKNACKTAIENYKYQPNSIQQSFQI